MREVARYLVRSAVGRVLLHAPLLMCCTHRVLPAADSFGPWAWVRCSGDQISLESTGNNEMCEVMSEHGALMPQMARAIANEDDGMPGERLHSCLLMLLGLRGASTNQYHMQMHMCTLHITCSVTNLYH